MLHTSNQKPNYLKSSARNNNIKKNRGFTLPETVVTIAVLASVMLYFILAFTVGKYTTKISKERSIVSNLLRSEMETVLNSNYPIPDTAKGAQDTTINDGLRDLTITKTVDFTTEDPGVYGYQKIYIKMEWAGGVTHNQILREEAVLYFTK